MKLFKFTTKQKIKEENDELLKRLKDKSDDLLRYGDTGFIVHKPIKIIKKEEK